MTLCVLGALVLARAWFGMTKEQAVTVSFLTLASAQLWHVFNMRDPGSRLFRNDITRNRFIWGALALCSGLLVAAVYVPALALVLRTVDPGIKGWILVIVMSLIPLAIGQVAKSIRRK
jgi:Ca2+-transporting ATPase